MMARAAHPDPRREGADQRGLDRPGADRSLPGDPAVPSTAGAIAALNLGLPSRATTVDPFLERDDGGPRWAVLARARVDGSPRLVAAAEDAVFRRYLPLAAELAAAAGEQTTGDLQQTAELGLAQAVLAWRRSDGVGFVESARRSIGSRLRIAAAQGSPAREWAVNRAARSHEPQESALWSGRADTGSSGQGVEVAMLDRAGVIVSVNDAWREFSAANDGNGSRTGVGMSYLAVCDAAGDDVHAADVGTAIRAAAAGDLPAPISVVVPCHAPAVERWYDVLISPRVNRFRTIGVAVTLTLRAAGPLR